MSEESRAAKHDYRPISPPRGSEPFKVLVRVPGGGRVVADAVRWKGELSLQLPDGAWSEASAAEARLLKIDMHPVLQRFEHQAWLQQFDQVADGEEPCAAELRRADALIARCRLIRGHSGDHVEPASTHEYENWPPRAAIRWQDGVTAFVTYDHTRPGTWVWEDEEESRPPSIAIPFTGRLGAGVRRFQRRRWGRRRFTFRVPLPPMEDLVSHRRSVDPLTLFVAYVGGQIGGVPEGKVLNAARIFLCPIDYDQLIALERFWVERLVGNWNASWLLEMNLAPFPFEARPQMPQWAEPGSAYVAERVIQVASQKLADQTGTTGG